MSEPRLYLVTPPAFEPADFAETLRGAIEAGGVACVRLAMPAADEALLTRAANHLMPVCHARDVPLVVADHWRLVEPLGLDGVHLGEKRPPVRKAREALGRDRIVGAHGGTSRHDAMIAAEAGADYVSLGPVAADALGDGAVAERDVFAWWSEMIETPVVAEGGLSLELARGLAEVADFLAPRRSVWEAPEGPAAAVAAYSALLSVD